MRSIPLLLVLLGAVTSCSDEPAAAPSYLFIVEAPSSEIVDGADGHELVVPLDEVVTWFTDRPVRSAGNVTMEDFVDSWEADGFTADPPEAALEVMFDGKPEVLIVEMGAPATIGRSVHFPLEEVEGLDGEAAALARRTASMSLGTATFGATGLFIESTRTCTPCRGAGS